MRKLVLKIFSFILLFLLLLVKPSTIQGQQECDNVGISSTLNGNNLPTTLSPEDESINLVVSGLSTEKYKVTFDRTSCANYDTPLVQPTNGTAHFVMTKTDYVGLFTKIGLCGRGVELFLKNESGHTICQLGTYLIPEESTPISCSVSITDATGTPTPYPDKNDDFNLNINAPGISANYIGGLHNFFELHCNVGHLSRDIYRNGRASDAGFISLPFSAGELAVSKYDCTLEDGLQKNVCYFNFTVFENNEDPTKPPEGYAQPITILKPQECNIGSCLTIDTSTGECLEWTGGSGIQTVLGCFPTEPKTIISWILKYAVIMGGGIAFLLMIFAGFQIIMSSGDPEKLKNGQQLLGAAIAGLLFIIFSVFLLRLIGFTILRIPGFG